MIHADNRFCRNCLHHRDGHIVGLNWYHMKHSTDYRACYGKNYYITNMDSCPCPEYVPKDNLEYLEWCVDKRRQHETSKR